MSYIDLHIHSNYSNDGEYSPAEIISMCYENGLKTVAISDHNSVKGIREAKCKANELGLDLISAIELNCIHKGINIHILGYFIDEEYPEFLNNENMILEQEQRASKKRIDLVRNLGINVDLEEIAKLAVNGVVTGEMIAEVSLNDEINKNNDLLRPYFKGGIRSDNPYVNFYWDFCSQDKPAYIPIQYINLNEATLYIVKSGGIAVLAHPGINIGEDECILKDIINQGICGIEVYSSYHSDHQTEFYKNKTKELNLAVTCGSDFHGKIKPKIKVGSVSCEGREAEIINSLRSYNNIS